MLEIVPEYQCYVIWCPATHLSLKHTHNARPTAVFFHFSPQAIWGFNVLVTVDEDDMLTDYRHCSDNDGKVEYLRI